MISDPERSEKARAMETRVRTGEWLRLGEVAALFEVHRSTADRWMRKGVTVRTKTGDEIRLEFPFRQSPGGHRSFDPTLLVELLESTRIVHVGDS